MLLIAGASGFLGANTLLEAGDAGREVVGAFHATRIRGKGVRAVATDLSAPGASRELLESLRPEWVLNCAALANVDACERDPEHARRINADLPRALAAASRNAGVRLLHISTDAVFDGRTGDYDESAEPAPLNVYARTKLEGERAVLEENPDALVVRTNFIGLSPYGRTGLADWIAGSLQGGRTISGFTDVVFSPLLANDLARVLFAMMDAQLTGLYHVAGSGPISKFDFAVKLARALGADESLVKPSRVADAGLDAPRPLRISLSSARAESALGQRMPTVETSVERLAELRRSGHRERLNALIGK